MEEEIETVKVVIRGSFNIEPLRMLNRSGSQPELTCSTRLSLMCVMHMARDQSDMAIVQRPGHMPMASGLAVDQY